jgi:hypothetical protein
MSLIDDHWREDQAERFRLSHPDPLLGATEEQRARLAALTRAHDVVRWTLGAGTLLVVLQTGQTIRVDPDGTFLREATS